jgi:hypothetical protein
MSKYRIRVAPSPWNGGKNDTSEKGLVHVHLVVVVMVGSGGTKRRIEWAVSHDFDRPAKVHPPHESGRPTFGVAVDNCSRSKTIEWNNKPSGRGDAFFFFLLAPSILLSSLRSRW